MDSTLVDFSDMKWQRGDLTFIFNGDVKGMCTEIQKAKWVFLGLQRYIFLETDTHLGTSATIRYTIRYILTYN